MEKSKKQRVNKCLIGVRTGDSNSLNSLYELIGHSIRYISLKYLKNEQDAKDLEQDFWAEIYKIADKYLYYKNGFGYLCKIMTRMALNRYKKLYGEKQYVVQYVDYGKINQFDENAVIDEIDCRAAVQKAFATLDVAEQIVMQLAIYEDKTIVQIAKELDMSKSQVGRIKLSAIAKLKTALEASGYGKTDEN